MKAPEKDDCTNLLDVLVLIDTGCQGRGEALVDIGLAGELAQRLHTLLSEELLLGILVHPVQASLIRFAEVNGVYVGLVHGLHLALSGVHTHRGSSVDTYKRVSFSPTIDQLLSALRHSVTI